MSPEARPARERKQKIFVAVGGLVLLALLAYQLPKLLGGSESSSAAPTTATTTAGGEATSGTPGAPSQVSASLTDTDRPLAVGPGQLRSFSVFSRKDPFVQQLTSPDSAEGGSTAATGGGSTTPAAELPSKGFKVGQAAAVLTLISVNGARQALVPGVAFPAGDPVFVLVAEHPDANAVVIGIAGGSYANGARTTKLKVGKPLVLVNTTTGARYRLVLVAVGQGETGTDVEPQESTPTTP